MNEVPNTQMMFTHTPRYEIMYGIAIETQPGPKKILSLFRKKNCVFNEKATTT